MGLFNKRNSYRQPPQPPRMIPGAPALDAYSFRGSVDLYFEQLLRGCFGNFEIRRDVDARTMGSASVAPVSAPAGQWTCACGNVNTANFCGNCGAQRPVSLDWQCRCGSRNTARFCPYCGTQKPAVPAPATVPTSVSGKGDLNFVILQNGVPKAAIILCDKNRWDTKEIREAMDLCRRRRLPCLRFMREFRNTAEYVTTRISREMR